MGGPEGDGAPLQLISDARGKQRSDIGGALHSSLAGLFPSAAARGAPAPEVAGGKS
jgi:hypothetical protein